MGRARARFRRSRASEDLELVGGRFSRSGAGTAARRGPRSGLAELVIRSASVAEALATPCDVLIDYTSPEAVPRQRARGGVPRRARRDRHVGTDRGGLRRDRRRPPRKRASACWRQATSPSRRCCCSASPRSPRGTCRSGRSSSTDSADKPDAPSGTARELAARLARCATPAVGHPPVETHGLPEARGRRYSGSPVHSVRLPGFVSSIEILFGAARRTALDPSRLRLGRRALRRRDASRGPEVGGFSGLAARARQHPGALKTRRPARKWGRGPDVPTFAMSPTSPVPRAALFVCRGSRPGSSLRRGDPAAPGGGRGRPSRSGCRGSRRRAAPARVGARRPSRRSRTPATPGSS